MSNSAGRLFEIIKNTSKDTQPNQSEYITLTIKSLNPLILNLDDRLNITSDFCVFDTTVDMSKLAIGNVLNAIRLNDGQLYYIVSNGNDTSIIEKLNSLGTYVADEAIVGTWIDGTPVYRNIFGFDATSLHNNHTIRIPILNLNIVIAAFGNLNLRTASGSINQPIPCVVPNSDIDYNIGINNLITGSYLEICFGVGYTGINSGFIIIEYTKSIN